MKKLTNVDQLNSDNCSDDKTVVGGKNETLFEAVGFTSAVSYDIPKLSDVLRQQDSFRVCSLVPELKKESIFLESSNDVSSSINFSKKFIVIFEYGSVVFWNVSGEDQLRFTKILSEEGVFDPKDVYDHERTKEECEVMDYTFLNENNNSSSVKKSHLSKNGVMNIVYSDATSDVENKRLEVYAFSNAISASTKLGILEANLDQFINSIEHLSDELKTGQISITKADVLCKTGQLFALRHTLNLSSVDFLDTPDFYWDRDCLNDIYRVMYLHLQIGKRSRLMNEKLNHCVDLMNLLANNLDNSHHIRLEWFIIVLIMIEVGFEFLRFGLGR